MTNGTQLGEHIKKLVDNYNKRMDKEPDMSYAHPLRATNHLYIDESGAHIKTNEQERETVEADMHQARLGAKVRAPRDFGKANDKQVGGDHYKNMGVEPWDVVDTWPLYQRIGAYRAGALKYLMRMGAKDEAAQEIGKGLHYLEKLLEVLKEQRDAD